MSDLRADHDQKNAYKKSVKASCQWSGVFGFEVRLLLCREKEGTEVLKCNLKNFIVIRHSRGG